MKLPKFNSYQGGNLKGNYDVYIKLDGVCVHATDEGHFSKRGKPLYNMPVVPNGYYEAFDTDWDTTVSKARTQGDGKGRFDPRQLYSIYPERDPRLYLGAWGNPTEELIKAGLKEQLDKGHEGLILWPRSDCRSQKPIKVKDEITVDVRVTGIVEGKGQFKCMLGKFQTDHGDVGTGFDFYDRYGLFHPDMVGEIIEAKIMEWTKNNKMRHARFERWRWDKDTENLEGLNR